MMSLVRLMVSLVMILFAQSGFVIVVGVIVVIVVIIGITTVSKLQ